MLQRIASNLRLLSIIFSHFLNVSVQIIYYEFSSEVGAVQMNCQ